METKKDVVYTGKDFRQLKSNLINFAKQYFPNVYTNFEQASPGTLFIDLAAYVGDVLSFYADSNLKESLLEQATERTNIYDLAKALGYKPNNSVAAQVILDIFQLLPASGSGLNVKPDFNYALSVKPNLIAQSSDGAASFRTLDSINFLYSSSYDPTDITIYEVDPVTKSPTYYLLKKQVKAVSGELKTKTFTFTNPIPYDKIVLTDTNVIEIISVTETDGDNWYEVPYLAQDTIFEEVPNLAENDPELSIYRSSSPCLLKLRKTAKRFITRTRSDGRTELQFGAGISDDNDEEIIPNPSNVGNGLDAFRKSVNIDLDPANFLYTRTYGQAPNNTTLTVVYTVGRGITDNVAADTLTKLASISFDDDINSNLNTNLSNFIKSSLTVNNSTPASGGKSADTIQEIKNNAMASFAAQNRLVTREDYIIRCYSMPSRFGSVAKAYIVPDDQIAQESYEQNRVANPLAMNMYVLGYNENKNLVALNQAIKQNLKTYLDQYRMLTDAINIKDAFIINIGIDFEISVLSNYNSNEVLLKCINQLKSFFDVDRLQINQPIIKSDILTTIANVKGVQSVIAMRLLNLYDSDFGYSGNIYDLERATKNGVIYPSLDPSIFELKFPNKDIRGRVVNY
ncbi:MAG: hypothetical protein EBT26_04555 [Microbacteriaceae bacterium]|nr:hypothetical protein [Microbacteriaceae bacterium]